MDLHCVLWEDHHGTYSVLRTVLMLVAGRVWKAACCTRWMPENQSFGQRMSIIIITIFAFILVRLIAEGLLTVLAVVENYIKML